MRLAALVALAAVVVIPTALANSQKFHEEISSKAAGEGTWYVGGFYGDPYKVRR